MPLAKILIDFTRWLFYTKNMNYVAAFLVLGLCFAAMAIGLIVAKRILRRGCSIDPNSCACRREGKDPAQCDK